MPQRKDLCYVYQKTDQCEDGARIVMIVVVHILRHILQAFKTLMTVPVACLIIPG